MTSSYNPQADPNTPKDAIQEKRPSVIQRNTKNGMPTASMNPQKMIIPMFSFLAFIRWGSLTLWLWGWGSADAYR
ncbi:hypothetical protein GCM10026982_58430 [Nocardiopsis aegyptia]